jgi:hypothetical protein
MAFLTKAANRGSVSTGPYEIDNSLKFEEDNTEFLWKTFSGEGTGEGKTFTISAWIKRTELGGIDIVMGVGRDVGGDNNDGAIRFNSDQFQFVNFASNAYNVRTNAVFRDCSAWYHIMVAVDTTQATDSNRVKLYVNGEQQTSLTGTAYPTQNYQFKWGRAEEHMIGARPDSDATAGEPQASQLWSGYMADVYFIDGSQLAPTDFGEYDDDSGIWIPKQRGGSYGNNGFKLEFKNSSNLGEDTSGNSNDFTENNITSIDQATDTPTNNFCTINALVDNAFAIFSLTEGGTRGPNTGEGNKAVGTFGVSSGKWYWEGVTTSASGTNYWEWGITRVDMQQGFSHDPGQGSAWYSAENTFNTQTGVGSASPTYNTGITSYTVGDIWSISLNCDVNPYEITLRFNNSVPGTAANNTDRSVGTFASADAVMPYYFLYNIASDDTWHNFGNPFISTLSGGNSDANGYGDFKYAPPSGYYALCSKNLAEFG